MNLVAYQTRNADLDINATVDNVRRFFKNDFETYLSRAGMHRSDLANISLSSPKLSATGGGSHAGNSAESKIMQLFDYEAKCGAVYRAIEDCSDNPNLNDYNREILKYTYLLRLRDSDIAERIGLSESTVRAKRREALCDFANRIIKWQIRFDTEIPELRVPKQVGVKSG